AGERRRDDGRRDRDAEGQHQPLGSGLEVAALPRQQRAERDNQEQRDEQRDERQVEEWRANRDDGSRQRLQRQRVERADDDGGEGGGEKDVVEDERPFP